MAIIPAAATKESVRVDFPTAIAMWSETHSKYSRKKPACGVKALLLTMVHMSNNTHVTDVLGKVHKSTNLLDGKLHHGACVALKPAISRTTTNKHDARKPPPEVLAGDNNQLAALLYLIT